MGSTGEIALMWIARGPERLYIHIDTGNDLKLPVNEPLTEPNIEQVSGHIDVYTPETFESSYKLHWLLENSTKLRDYAIYFQHSNKQIEANSSEFHHFVLMQI